MPTPARLILVRHAHASAPMPGQPDFDRALDTRGHEEAATVHRQAEALGISTGAIISSAARRCFETATALSHLSAAPQIVTDERLYAGSLDTYLDVISRQASADLMLVGHNPVMEDLCAHLFGADFAAGIFPFGYPTAGLVAGERLEGDGGLRYRPRFVVTPSFSERY